MPACPGNGLRKRIDAALDRFHIAHLQQNTVFNLSAGERQKAILAAVYAMHTDIWALDEPSANLDSTTVKGLKTVIRSLKREGKTLIIADHRCHYLKGLADRIILLDDGRIDSVHTANTFYLNSNAQINRHGLRWIHASTGFPTVSTPTIEQRENSRLAARNLCFGYPGKTKDVLQKANLSGAGGEIIALTGANGTGKNDPGHDSLWSF